MKETIPLYFSLFNEIGIISQLSRALLDARLPDGIIGSHFGVLNHLIRVKDGRTPLELTNSFQVPKTTMTHTISGLEKHKLVLIKPHPEDGRSKQVWLTEKGRDLRNGTIASMSPQLVELLSPLPQDQIESLVSNLTKIRILLDNNRD